MQLRKFYNLGIGRSSFTWQKQTFSSTHGMKGNSQVPWDSELSEPGQRKVDLVFLGGGLAAEEQEVAVSRLRPCWGGRSSLVVVQTMRASRGGGCPSQARPFEYFTSHTQSSGVLSLSLVRKAGAKTKGSESESTTYRAYPVF